MQIYGLIIQFALLNISKVLKLHFINILQFEANRNMLVELFFLLFFSQWIKGKSE